MAITWKDIKIKTLQKLFAADGDTIPNDTSTKDYIDAMPGAANEALQLLSTAGKFIIKHIDIAHNPMKNQIVDGAKIRSMERGVMTIEADRIRSLYFEFFGVGTYSIAVDGVEVESGVLENRRGYAPFRRLVENPLDKHVVLAISSDYPMAVKNVAMYSANFETEDDVQSFAEKIRYPLNELVDDFYKLDDEPVVYEGNADVSRYMKTSDFLQEGNTVIVLDRDTIGNFRVFYKAYPQSITSETTDDTELSIDPEVAALMPLYMASQLYKDDDNGIATSYRNEFEVAFERLSDSQPAPSAERFTSESGWI